MNTIKPLGLAKLFSLAPQPFIIKIVAWLISMREITTRLSLTLATRLGWRGKMQPGRRERTGRRGSVYVRKGDYDKAQSDFNKAIHRRGPDFDSTAIEVATKLTQNMLFWWPYAMVHGQRAYESRMPGMLTCGLRQFQFAYSFGRVFLAIRT